MLPVQNAIGAGNCVIIKPSEIAPACAQFLADYIPKYLDSVRGQLGGGVGHEFDLLQN